jgi:hypothetical protein
MPTTGKRLLLFLGLLLALLFGYLRARGSAAWLIPWLLVGGAGLICGVLYSYPTGLRIIILSLIGLVVALSAILLQDFNPTWLSDIVFWVRVFFAHFLLSFALLYLVKPRRDAPDL